MIEVAEFEQKACHEHQGNNGPGRDWHPRAWRRRRWLRVEARDMGGLAAMGAADGAALQRRLGLKVLAACWTPKNQGPRGRGEGLLVVRVWRGRSHWRDPR